MNKIKVLYLITTLRPYGGAEVALANLIPYLDTSIHTIWVGTVFAREDQEVKIQLPGEYIRYFEFSKKYYFDLKGYLRLIKFLKVNKIDVIHTHLFAANTVGRVAGKLAGVPVIISTEHNTYVNKSKMCISIDRILARVTSRIMAVSDAVVDYYATQTEISPSLIESIPNCVPLDQIRRLTEEEKAEKRKTLGIAPDEQIILSVGRLTEQKGFEYLIDGAARVLEKHRQARFLIAGMGALRDELQCRIDGLGITDRVCLIGFRDDIFELLQISDLFVLSSLWEGLGVVLIEAGACGLPVVTTDVGAVLEVITHGKNGLVVPKKDVRALAESISLLLSSPEERLAMGEEARKRVEQNFSGPTVARKIEKLYRQFLPPQVSTTLNGSAKL